MTYLAIQNSYEDVQIALCVNQGIIARTAINKIDASAHCIPALDALLTEQNVTLSDVSCIIANCGPGPFTTLRVVLATVNGIQAASGIPLIGIDSLDALIQEHKDKHSGRVTVALLNAFNQDVYYAIADSSTHNYKKGYQNIQSCITELTRTYPDQSLYFVGNGALLHKERIIHTFGSQALMPIPLPETCSLDQIQKMGFHQWQAGSWQTTPLMPHYLKSAAPKL